MTRSAGALRDRVTIQRRTDTEDALGTPVPAWNTLVTVWAQVAPLQGSERFVADQLEAEVDHVITVRYDPALATVVPKDRIQHDGRTFDVEAALRDPRRRHLQILAKEVV